MKQKPHPIRKMQDAFDKAWERANSRMLDR